MQCFLVFSILLFDHVSGQTERENQRNGPMNNLEKTKPKRQLAESTYLLQQERECIRSTSIPQTVWTNGMTDLSCKNDNCATPTSCCRIFNWLKCDRENRYPFLACVCHDYTDLATPMPTPEPTTALPTRYPTPDPTSKPTPDPTSPPTMKPTTQPSSSPTTAKIEPKDTTVASPAIIGGATAGVALLFLLIFLSARRRKKAQSDQPKRDKDIFNEEFTLEHHVEIESLPGDLYSPGMIIDDLDMFTKSPKRRGLNTALSSQDELDGVFNNNHAGYKHRLDEGYAPQKTRSYMSTDTVDL